MNGEGKRYIEQGNGRRYEVSMLIPGCTPSQHLDVSTILEALQISSFRGFYGGFITYTLLIKSLAICN